MGRVHGRSKKKKDAESSLGLVSFPVQHKMTKSNSTLNKDAEAFVPKSSRKKSPWESQIQKIHALGMNTSEEKLESLLKKYNGDISKTVNDLIDTENKI